MTLWTHRAIRKENPTQDARTPLEQGMAIPTHANAMHAILPTPPIPTPFRNHGIRSEGIYTIRSAGIYTGPPGHGNPHLAGKVPARG
jgi:hypothetical protein